MATEGSMTASGAPARLWSPSPERIARSRLRHYMDWLAAERGLHFADYNVLWQWSVSDLEAFWGTVWDYFAIKAHKPYSRVLASRDMPGAKWFPGAELNYVDQVLRHATDTRPAILYAAEQQALRQMSWQALRDQIASVAAYLRSRGINRGDRVVAYASNTPETIV